MITISSRDADELDMAVRIATRHMMTNGGNMKVSEILAVKSSYAGDVCVKDSYNGRVYKDLKKLGDLEFSSWFMGVSLDAHSTMHHTKMLYVTMYLWCGHEDIEKARKEQGIAK